MTVARPYAHQAALAAHPARHALVGVGHSEAPAPVWGSGRERSRRRDQVPVGPDVVLHAGEAACVAELAQPVEEIERSSGVSARMGGMAERINVRPVVEWLIEG